jgi:hypothetical protein
MSMSLREVVIGPTKHTNLDIVFISEDITYRHPLLPWLPAYHKSVPRKLKSALIMFINPTRDLGQMQCPGSFWAQIVSQDPSDSKSSQLTC